MADQYRFGDYQRASRGGHEVISLNEVMDLRPKIQRDAEGNVIPYEAPKIRLTPEETVRLISPYVSVRFMDQVKAVVPLGVYLALFQILFLQRVVEDSWVITGGLFAVIVGLMFFMEGLKLGLMPFGTEIGSTLPQRSSLPTVLLITLLLGVGVTFAEPAIGALQTAGRDVSVEQAPYLYALLNFWSTELVLVVGISVGAAAVLGTLRFLFSWSLKPLIYLSLVPLLALTLYASFDPEIKRVIGLAWDCGAVTTGPVTVPVVLAIGLGFGNAANAVEGFGILCMASVGPILTVLITGLWARYQARARALAEAQIPTDTTAQEAKSVL